MRTPTKEKKSVGISKFQEQVDPEADILQHYRQPPQACMYYIFYCYTPVIDSLDFNTLVIKCIFF